MKQQKTVESRVLEILKECPMSRYDDMLLILHYYNQYGYIPAGNLPLEDIVFNYRAYGLPCFETMFVHLFHKSHHHTYILQAKHHHDFH